MASRSDSHRPTCVVVLDSRSHKGVVDSTLSAPRSDNESDELRALEKGTFTPSHASTPASSHASSPAPSHTSAPTLAKSTLALKCSKTDLIRILKIFSETKSQEPKVEVSCEQFLKAKIPNIYFGKLYINCYHFCQQCKDYFETTGTTKSNCILFAVLFLHRKINFWWHQHWKQFSGVFTFWEEFKVFLKKNLGDSRSFVDTI